MKTLRREDEAATLRLFLHLPDVINLRKQIPAFTRGMNFAPPIGEWVLVSSRTRLRQMQQTRPIIELIL
jgi:hypothetical protein